VLAVEDLRFQMPVVDFPPGKCDVQLGTAVKKLLDEPPQPRSGGARVDALVVKDVLDGKVHVGRGHAGQFVAENRGRAGPDSQFRQRRCFPLLLRLRRISLGHERAGIWLMRLR
jgi:hypothetical protein